MKKVKENKKFAEEQRDPSASKKILKSRSGPAFAKATAGRQAEKLFVILGPTATGKTKLAVDLACKFNGEIISADT